MLKMEEKFFQLIISLCKETICDALLTHNWQEENVVKKF